jgi:DNA-binding SARP family transcriptional activator
VCDTAARCDDEPVSIGLLVAQMSALRRELAAVYQMLQVRSDVRLPNPQAAAASAHLYVTFLGQFSVYRDHQRVALGHNRPVIELGRYLLARQGRLVQRDELLELLWPDASPAEAGPRLHVATSSLRRLVDLPGTRESIIVFHNDSYIVPTQSAVLDVDLFEAAYQAGRQQLAGHERGAAAAEFRRALDLYRGDYLADDPYAEWTFRLRAHFVERRISILLFLAEYATATDDQLAVVDYARQVLEADNLCERAHRDLMRAHYRLGQRACAVRQFQACAAVLRDELSVTPSRLTQELYRAIRNDAELPAEPSLHS